MFKLTPCFLVPALATGLACSSDTKPGGEPLTDDAIVLTSDSASVRVTLKPFTIAVLNGAGETVLESLPTGTSTESDNGSAYGAPAATVDDFTIEPRLLPGWDGYTAAERPWRHAGSAEVLEQTPSSLTLNLSGTDVTARFEISMEGTRARFHFDASTPKDPDTTYDITPPTAAKLAQAGEFNKATFAFKSPLDEHFFGLGERYASLDHRGLSLYTWAEEGGIGIGENEPLSPTNPMPNGPSMTYFPVPFALSSSGYGIHVATTYRSEMHFASEREDAWRFAVNATEFDWVVYVNESPLDTLEQFTADTGRPVIPTPWVFGPRRRGGVNATRDGKEEIALLRELDIPMTAIDDAIHFLPANSHVGREDQLRAWTTRLHELGYKAICYNNPYIDATDEAAVDEFSYGKENSLLVVGPDGEPALTSFISGKLRRLATIDLTSPAGVSWFQQLLKRSLDLGYDGWMHDFGEYVPRDAVLSDGRRGEEVHNEYPVLSAKAAFDLLEKERPGDYLFFVRAGGTGTQAFTPAVWGGDPEATFDETSGLPASLRGGLGLSMSGVPYWGSDMTGFKCMTDAPLDKEIFIRWIQFGAVSPIMMEQNACLNVGGPKRTKWTLWSDEETPVLYGRYSRLHTRLLPYFMVLAKRAHEKGTPLTLHPFLLHPDSEEAWAVDDAFYVGPALYALPVVRRGQTERKSWLPPGRYVDLDDYKAYSGGAVVTIPAPLEKLPLLLVENQILPLLDKSIQTLAPATDPNVVTPATVADRLDVLVALAPGGSAELTLDDGTRLRAERTSSDAGNPDSLEQVAVTSVADCAECFSSSAEGDVQRLRMNSALTGDSTLHLEDLVLTVEVASASNAPRRVRWDVMRLP